MKYKKLAILCILTLFFFFGGETAHAAKFNASQDQKKLSGLIGLWSFDGKDVVNGVPLDKSGSGKNGKLFAIATSTFYKVGKIGQAFQFDGSTSYMTIPYTSSFYNPGTGDFAYSAWIKLNTNSGARMIVGQYNGATGLAYMYIDTNNLPTFYVRSNPGAITSFAQGAVALNDGQWHHLVAMRTGGSGGGPVLYVDGVLANTGATGIGNIDVSGCITMFVGAFRSDAVCSGTPTTANESFFSGSIDDLRIYNRALSAEEVKALYLAGGGKQNASQNLKQTNGLVGLWSFDGKDVVNGVVVDRSGSGNNLNLLGSVATSTFYTQGKIGQAFNFDGTDDYLNIADNVPVSITGSITISAWIYRDTTNTADGIVGKWYGDANIRSYLLGVNGANPVQFSLSSNNTGATSLTANTTIAANRWYHVVGTYDGTNMQIYLDGVLDATPTPHASGIVDNAAPLRIGDGDFGYWPFDGKIDEVRIYNRALSAAEIKALYLAGGGKQNASQNLKQTSGLVGLWSFDGKDVVNGVVKDRSGSGNDGNLSGIATSTFYSIGKIGQAFTFDGSDKIFNFGTQIIPATGDKTLSIWAKTTSATRMGLMGTREANNSNGAVFSLIGGSACGAAATLCYFIPGGSGGTALYASPTIDAGWNMYTYTQASGTGTLYFNGTSVATGSIGTMAASTFKGVIGAEDGDLSAPGYFIGSLDDARIYNRALSAAEVASLYYSGGGQRASSAFAATGGTITTDGLYTVHTFTSSGTFTVTSGSATAAVLVVAGGGGGGQWNSGGGGGGGVVYNASYALTPGSYTVTVGNGGNGGTTGSAAVGAAGSQGQNSVFGATTATGGGGGGAYNGTVGTAPATDGGSGGGGGVTTTVGCASSCGSGGSGTAGQGNNGGVKGQNNSPYAGSGGGGAGAVGSNYTAGGGGAGGIGVAYSISGVSTYYGGGGGGGGNSGTYAAGGNGGGGCGGVAASNGTTCFAGSATPVAGTANTGGGGGGGGGTNNATGGRAGGSGIVIVRYLTP